MLRYAARTIVGRVQLFNQARKFTNCPEPIKELLKKQNINEPTDIQKKTLPIVMDKKDLVGIARTGSGKTLAFVIPAVMNVLEARQQQQQQQQQDNQHSTQTRKPTCLVLAPTRELANQITSVTSMFNSLGLNSLAIVGGSNRMDQVYALERKNTDIYVATPGRLMDLMDTRTIDLSTIKYLVLDEADRMLDMGFEPQIRRILESIPKERQTLMWSATWPQEIQNLASQFMREFEFIAVDSEQLKANPNITQIIDVVSPQAKFNQMIKHLDSFKADLPEPRTLIFTNTKRMAEQLLILLMRERIRAISIHGDRTQRQRDDAIRLFKNHLCHTLVATDVAARGLDISDISHVINFDFPNTIEDYIHRIGRTARHDRTGVAVSLITENNANMARKLIHVLKETNQLIPDALQTLTKRTLLDDSPNYNKRRARNDFYSSGRPSSSFSGYDRDRNRNYDDRNRNYDDRNRNYNNRNRNYDDRRSDNDSRPSRSLDDILQV